MDLLDDDEVLRSLQGTICPACGRGKSYARTLCGTCYFTLPKDQRASLYQRRGAGYERAVNKALKTLGINSPYLP